MTTPNAHSVFNIEAFLRPSLFGTLPATELLKLVKLAKIERFVSSQPLNHVGQTLQWLRLVVEGGISISAAHASGKEVLISMMGPGAWVSWLPCFVQEPLATAYTASPGSVFIALPIPAVRECFDANPNLYPLVMAEISKRMRLLMEWTSQSALLMPEQRLARLIFLLAKNRNLNAVNNVLEVTQTQLADLIGCSRQSASKLFASLESRGLILMGYGKCEIPNIAALRAYSESLN